MFLTQHSFYCRILRCRELKYCSSVVQQVEFINALSTGSVLIVFSLRFIILLTDTWRIKRCIIIIIIISSCCVYWMLVRMCVSVCLCVLRWCISTCWCLCVCWQDAELISRAMDVIEGRAKRVDITMSIHNAQRTFATTLSHVISVYVTQTDTHRQTDPACVHDHSSLCYTIRRPGSPWKWPRWQCWKCNKSYVVSCCAQSSDIEWLYFSSKTLVLN